MTLTPAEPTDEELLARSVLGDEAAFEEIVRRHQATVGRVAGGLLAWSDEVGDAVQDVWMTSWRRRATFAERSTVKTWLTGITIHVCRNRQRSRWFRRPSNNVPTPVREDVDCLEVDEDHQAVRDAMKQLPARVREVAVLYYLEELTTAEIAAQLNLSPNTVDKRLQRSRERLRVLLKDRRP